MSDRFSAAIAGENARGFVAVIPDIKRVSPKAGDLLQGRDPVESARCLEGLGAPALSVVTESERFGGGPGLLRAVTRAVNAPVLRKDFIKNADMIEETAELGASAVLLICSIVDEKTLAALYEKSLELGLEPLVETHTAEEMRLAARLGARLIGVNNREITTLELDDGGPEKTAELAPGMPAGALLISESGILSPEDARLAASAGANAILIGTALWRAGDIGAAYRSFRVARSEIS